jgi:N-acetylglucosamine-6-sulfatase
LFENAFVTTSLCSPSRASILTGQYVHAHGVNDNGTPLPRQLATFPMELQRLGYHTGFIGKWHMGGASDEPRPGFDRWVSFRGQGTYNDPTINFDGKRRQVKGYTTDILTEEALRFIGQNRSRPFLLYLSHKAVHGPFTPAKRHKHLYANDEIPWPESMADTEENYHGKPDWLRRQRRSFHGIERQPGLPEDRYRDYTRAIMAVDESVGRVHDTLHEQGLLNDTLFIYMGDNGFMWGDHGLVDKRAMYEPSIRVPMMAHCPDLFEGGRRVPGLALNIDICPTFLDAAGATIPSSVQGRSLLSLLNGASDWRRDFVYEYFWERSFPQTPTVIGLRSDEYSFMRYHGIWDLYELYDMQKDPNQKNNLLGHVRTRTEGGRLSRRIQDPELQMLVAGFEQRIKDILASTGGRMEPRWQA